MCPPITYLLLPTDNPAYHAAHVSFVAFGIEEWAEDLFKNWPRGFNGEPATHIVFADPGMCKFITRPEGPVRDVERAYATGYEEACVWQVFLHLYQDGIEWVGNGVRTRRLTWEEIKR